MKPPLTPVLHSIMSRLLRLALMLALQLTPTYGFGQATATTAQNQLPMLRVATFNASLHRNKPGELLRDLKQAPETGDTDHQIANIASIIRHIRPHILLLNEFDFYGEARGYDRDNDRSNELSARLFKKNYLEVSGLTASPPLKGTQPIHYKYHYVAPSNTGVPAGADLNNDGNTDGKADVQGYGDFPGQYGMLLLSQHPIIEKNVRTFQNFLWRDMPDAKLPTVTTGTDAGNSYYSEAALSVLRLSSKSHWDIPVKINGKLIHILASHPTPPVFDGLEDRNGRRNHDEIRFWADYLSGINGNYIYDDIGKIGALANGSRFVILGDLNASPVEGDSTDNPMQLLLSHKAVNSTFTPESAGALENSPDNRFAASHTADWALQVDYVLPSLFGLRIADGAVFWPVKSDPLHHLVRDAKTGSDHRLVWLDLEITDTDQVGAEVK